MSDEQYINDWLDKANKDIKAVEKLKEDKDMSEIVCFHCQQAVEKYLKALLYLKKQDIPRTHNIDFLLNQCKKYNQKFEEYLGNQLSDYAVDLRYPDTKYIPTQDETEEAIELMYSIIEIVNNTIYNK